MCEVKFHKVQNYRIVINCPILALLMKPCIVVK